MSRSVCSESEKKDESSSVSEETSDLSEPIAEMSYEKLKIEL